MARSLTPLIEGMSVRKAEDEGVTRQGAMKLLQPLLDAGLIRRVGTRKSGRYLLK